MAMNNLFIKKPTDNGLLTASLNGQDRHAIDTIFFRKRNGFFLDIGASDGVKENNSFLFEKYYDWNGICCECDPRNIEKLCTNRMCHIFGSPIYKTTGLLVPFEMHKYEHLSGIAGYQSYRDISSKIVMLSTVSLMDCLRSCNAPKTIDYMSLDTEGTEFEILSTVDFNEYKINYIAYEHNFQEPKRTNIRNILLTNGYAHFRSIANDDDYIYIPYATANNIQLPA